MQHNDANHRVKHAIYGHNDSSISKFSLICSIILHIIFIYLLLFKTSFHNELPEEQIISFEILNVSDKSNVPNKQIQKDEPIENEDAKHVEQIKEIKASEVEKQIEEKPVEEPKIDPISKPDAEILPIKEEKKIEKKIEEKITQAPSPKKPVILQEKKLEKPKPKVADNKDLDKLLKNLEQSSEGKNPQSNKYARTQKTGDKFESKGPFDEEEVISITEANMIKQQIERNWNINITSSDLHDARITLFISLNQDGVVANVKLVNKKCGALSDNICQTLADSAQRAVWQSSPIQHLDPKRYNLWKEFNMLFDPSKLM